MRDLRAKRSADRAEQTYTGTRTLVQARVIRGMKVAAAEGCAMTETANVSALVTAGNHHGSVFSHSQGVTRNIDLSNVD